MISLVPRVYCVTPPNVIKPGNEASAPPNAISLGTRLVRFVYVCLEKAWVCVHAIQQIYRGGEASKELCIIMLHFYGVLQPQCWLLYTQNM